jgi:hypothetical protein
MTGGGWGESSSACCSAALAGLLALVMLYIGIPGAGALVPAPLLAQPWRAFGPYLPPGAAVNAMRGIGFFHGATTAPPLVVLAVWAAAGLILIALPTAGRHPGHRTDACPERGSPSMILRPHRGGGFG